MNAVSGDKPIVEMKGFNGLYSRGAYEACPPDHLTDCMNCIFPGPKQLTIREPITQTTYIAGRTIISYFIAQIKTGNVTITLDNVGNLRDETNSFLLNTQGHTFGSPPAVGQFTGADDVAAINIFGRVYLCLKQGGRPLSGSVLYYYDGTYFSPAGGPIPPSGMSATASATTTTTIYQAILPGVQKVYPASMTNITTGVSLYFLNPDGSNPEYVTVSSTGATYFYATFTLSHVFNCNIAAWSNVQIVNTTINNLPAAYVSLGHYPGGYSNQNLSVASGGTAGMVMGNYITIVNSDGSNSEVCLIKQIPGGSNYPDDPYGYVNVDLASSKTVGATIKGYTYTQIVNTYVSAIGYDLSASPQALPITDISGIVAGNSIGIANSDTTHSENVIVLSVVTTSVPNYITAVLTSSKTGPGIVVTLATGYTGPGVYTLAVAFQSPNGYLSPPSPKVTASTSGINSITLTNIPLVPTTVVNSQNWKRVILVSQANQTKLFFYPGSIVTGEVAGVIPDNLTTTANINFYDTNLISSADYLNDVLPSIPAASSLKFYAGRLVLIGATSYLYQNNTVPASPDQVLFSSVSGPETFDSVAGNVTFPVDYGGNNCSTGFVILNVLYILKPSGTYSTQDNGGDPNTWPVLVIDAALGAWDNGVSVFASSSSVSQDVFDSAFILTKRGLMIFQAGTYSPTALTKKVESLWSIVDDSLYPTSYFYVLQVAHDIKKKRVYIALPVLPPSYMGGFFTPSSGAKNIQTILMMDYQEGLDPDSVKWSTWTSQIFGAGGILKMGIENFTSNGAIVYQLTFCIGDAYIYKIAAPTTDYVISYTTPYIPDGTYPINQYIITSPVDTPDGIYVWLMLNLAVTGYGNMSISVLNKNRSYLSAVNTTIALAITAGLQTVTPGSMANITTSTHLTISDGVHSEIIVPSTVGGSTFAATFLYSYNAGATLQYNTINNIKGFNLSSYATSPYGQMELQRLINYSGDGMQVALQCDQSMPGGLNGFFLLVGIDIYGKKMWGMRPALVQSA